MNQDSDRGDNRPNDRRDGKGRSFGRRDDDRSTDRPRVNRSNDADQPRVNRDRTGRDNDRPSDNRRNDGPRNDRNTRSESPRFNRDNQNDRPRFSRDNDRRPDRPSDRPDRSNRDDRPRNPRFDRDERPRRSDESRSDRTNNRFGNERPRFNRDDNRSSGSSTVRPRADESRRDERQPRFNRDDKPRSDRNNDRFGNERPNRFSDRPNDRDRTDGRRDENPDSRPPRFSRDGFDKPRSDRSSDRPERRERGESDRDNRPSRFNRDDKPAPKRVGGFSREADERNRFGREDRTNQRSEDRRSDAGSEGGNREPRTNRDNNTDSRFSKEQRQESSDRRTGRYDKAPNYTIEQAPFKRRDRDDDSRPRGNQRGPSESGERPKRQPSDEPGLTRLNRYIANSGVCSRREADELIALGDISVNGKVVTEMGFKVKEGDTVKYGTKVLNPERFVYVLLNKPKDYITTTDDPEERRTVMELVADAGNFRMYPVGRLDRNTTGLLLLTNDGELADKLTHPSNNVRKIYQIEIDKPITNEDFEAIQRGVDLEDGPIKPDSISIITPDAQVIGIEIHSGRNRIVRRLFESLGYEVTKLDRTTFAGLTKKDLPRGKWRFLDPKEVVKLKYFNS